MGRRCAGDTAVSLCRHAILRNGSALSGTAAFRSRKPSSARCICTRSANLRPDDGRPRTALVHGRNHHRRTYATGVKDANEARIAIVGAGLTGLTSAYYLAKRLKETAKITIYEASDRAGGWIQTDKVEVDVGGKKGMVRFERGPRAVPSLNRSTWRYDDLVLWDLATDLGLPIHSPPDLPRYVFWPDHLVPLPPHTSFLQLLQEPLIWSVMPGVLGYVFRQRQAMGWATTVNGKQSYDISVGDWLKFITGSSAIGNNMFSAIMHGVYGGDIEKLSALSVVDEMFAKDMARRTVPKAVARGRFIRPHAERDFLQEMTSQNETTIRNSWSVQGGLLTMGRYGMEAIPKGLEAALRSAPNVEFKMGQPVDNLSYDNSLQKVLLTTPEKTNSPAQYDKVIFTLPGKTLHHATAQKASALAEEHSVSIMRVNLWYPDTKLKPMGTGYLIPRSVSPEQNPERALGVFFDSDIEEGLPTEAGEVTGTKLFVLLGGHYYDSGAPVPSEAEAVKQAKTLLARHLGIPVDTPCFAMASLAKECIPQHYVGHKKSLDTLQEQLKNTFEGRLAVAGGSYGRIGVLGALRAGYDVARRTAVDDFFTTGIDRQAAALGFESIPRAVDPFPIRKLNNY